MYSENPIHLMAEGFNFWAQNCHKSAPILQEIFDSPADRLVNLSNALIDLAFCTNLC